MRWAWALGAAVLACLGAAWLKLPPIGPVEYAQGPGALRQTAVDVTDASGAVQRFATALTFATVSNASVPGHVESPDAFRGLHAQLQAAFPAAFAALDVQRVAEWSLLLRWQGRDAALQPGLCISHLDVVPVQDAGRWTHPPFSGAVQDGCDAGIPCGPLNGCWWLPRAGFRVCVLDVKPMPHCGAGAGSCGAAAPLTSSLA